MTPRSEALAYRIWAEAKPIGWDCSVTDLAEALDETPQRIGMICRAKGWSDRFRVNPSNTDVRAHRPYHADELMPEVGDRVVRGEMMQ
ncbi:hypothetical protein [Limimaricola hongkongensis]|uniref:Uncharacterized protein n=1 Tax=Limimaricola hongkongensis DSM 17492 TaxID=1122180 RepID=A0A017HDB0_9RHOB|nr:hypothetical protein [Limimaricola hongkongensis]EYD71784.1 hypothetical protein Lokhon_01854 [Limimaricola hongkongensis DSM 17492]